MKKEKMLIQNKLGLHTRAAAKLVDIAKHYESAIQVAYHDRIVNCKSIMGVITLGAKKDCEIEVTAEGNDESDAINAIKALLDNKFGEE